MCSDCGKAIKLNMSNNGESFLVKDMSTCSQPDPREELRSHDPEDTKKEGEDINRAKGEENSSFRSGLGEARADVDEDEDDSGFKTPTTLDHKLPVVTQCPGAPKKPPARSSWRKRKASSSPPSSSSSSPPSSNVRRSLLFDLPLEMQTLLPCPIIVNMSRKIKRGRSDNFVTRD